MLTSNEFKEIFVEFQQKIKVSDSDKENSIPIDVNSKSSSGLIDIKEAKDKTIKDELLQEKANDDEFTIIFKLKHFFADRFSEATKIFNSFDSEGFRLFLKKCEYSVFEEKETVVSKGTDCNHYYFLLYGDIVFYSDSREDVKAKLLKTISGGVIFGHKIKEKIQYFAYAQSGAVQLIKILKTDFDDIVSGLNDKKTIEKLNFLKKHFPKFRTFPEDSIKKYKEFFFKYEYAKGSKIFLDGELEDYIYIIKNGECCALKKIKRVNGLKEALASEGVSEKKTHIVLEKYGKFNFLKYYLGKGDIIGTYSAIKDNKCNVTVEVISDRMKVYKIFKGDIFEMFGGKSGKVSEALRSLDSTQQIGMILKYDFLENCIKRKNTKALLQIDYIESSNAPLSKPKLFDESEIKNNLKDAYKALETAKNNKLNDLKSSLIPSKAKGLTSLRTIENPSEIKRDLLGTAPGKLDDKGKLLGLGGGLSRATTLQSQQSKLNALRPGLTTSQMASKNKLDSLLGIKKNTQNQDEVNEAFKRINDRKKAEVGGGSKLLSGIEYSTEQVTFDSLSKKIDNKVSEEKEVKKEELSNKSDNKEKPPEPKSTDDDNLIKKLNDLKLKSSDESNLSKTENLLPKKKSEENTEEVNKKNTGDIEIEGKRNIDDEAIKSIIKKRSSKVFTKKY